ncbi:MAG: hypothetical protein KAJ96_10055 [Candidatus Thorarchaeota archaeon]|nr:hypothetical protein [Candidatus Thorarchaeota archaeon]
MVEYYITAEDTFGKTTTALNGSDYFSYNVVAAAIVPPPDMTLLIIGVIIVIVVIVVLVYIFIIRPKQETT